MGSHVTHTASCPDVSPADCAVAEIPDHLHDLDLSWTRLKLGGGLGLGRGFALAAELPLDLRVVDVTYTTLDGAEYAPPYEDIHHRDEIIWGPADGQLRAEWFGRADAWVLGGWLGGTLPLGRTEEDPFAAGEAGEWHQHHQLGAGRPLLVLGASATRGGRWGLLSSAGGQIPVGTNGKGYRAPASLSLSVGPSWRAKPRIQLFSAAGWVMESAERWHGEPHGGRQAAELGLGGVFALRPELALTTELRAPVWQHLAEHEHGEDEDATLRLSPQLRAGLSWTR